MVAVDPGGRQALEGPALLSPVRRERRDRVYRLRVRAEPVARYIRRASAQSDDPGDVRSGRKWRLPGEAYHRQLIAAARQRARRSVSAIPALASAVAIP